MTIFWIAFVLLVVLAIYDVCQRRRTILRNFPIIGHFRYWLESIGPELRQYIVTSNNEERPFSRAQRRWIYASAKKANNRFSFGTDQDLENSPNFLIVKHSSFPLSHLLPGEQGFDPQYTVPCAKVLGEHRNRPLAFRPQSVVNISGMSFGSLSASAVEALNRGAKLAECLQNTGEGGISPHHQHGGELIWQIGTSYFGCRTDDGRFDQAKFLDTVDANPVRAIEIKLSQGAKPGVGGLLPAAKITSEIAEIRGIPRGKDCASPARHQEFDCVDSMLDFVESLAEATGLPVGIKSAVGGMEFWTELVQLMARGDRGVDFITIDGGEGGTGAAPRVFTDHVSLPFKIGISSVYREFFDHGLHEKVVFNGSGKLGFPERALFAFALGCDTISIAREAMMAIGCIQAQRCHTGHCPAGIATQNKWLMRGLDPTLKSARAGNFIVTLRQELLRLSRVCGMPHPSLITPDHFDILDDRYRSTSAAEWFGCSRGYGLPSPGDQAEIRRIMDLGHSKPAGAPAITAVSPGGDANGPAANGPKTEVTERQASKSN